MANTTTFAVAEDTAISEIERIFRLQQESQYEIARTTARQRKKKLDQFLKVMMDYRPRIKEALYKDFKKHPSEVDLSEVYPVTTAIKHTRSHLKEWMRKQYVSTPMSMLGSTSYVHYEPKGVVLIISPWNFPVNLTFGPLVSAVAAGNAVVIKPSEYTPHASAIMKEIVEKVFDESEVAVLEGGLATSQALLKLPFNHIFFTGAPSIGKIVMEAASKHLASVTLELGGKSPTIVDETADVKKAARRIAWGKFLNNGQVCIAPDYILVHKSKRAAFVKEVEKCIKDFYTDDPSSESSYSRIVNSRHHARINSYMKDALDKGGKVDLGGNFKEEENYIEPTIISGLPEDSKLLQEEIFGPILPIVEFTHIDEVVKIVNSKEKPLALYIYSKNRKNINHVINNTRAGGTCINNNGVHFFNHNLPFGGSNNSGIGKSHGWYGFQAFSNARSVLKQNRPGALEMLMPPYTDYKQKLIDLTIKYF